MQRLLLVALLISVGLGLTNEVSGQTVPGYLTDKGDAAVRVEIVGLTTDLPPQTGWQRLQALIGIRKTAPYKPEVGTTFTVQSSAYASSPYQTDSTPCITAVGTRVRPGVVASNFLPIGTVLDINGEKFIVEDRMNKRYDGYFLDIWFPSTSDALEFGRKNLTITVLGYEEPGTEIRKEPEPEEPSNEVVVPPEEPTFFERIRISFANLASLIGAKVSPDVNKYDIDCLSEESSDEPLQ